MRRSTRTGFAAPRRRRASTCNSEPVTLTGTLTEPAIDPYGNTKRGLTLSGTVDRTALGLTWNAPLPDGGTMLADEVELTAALLLVPGEER